MRSAVAPPWYFEFTEEEGKIWASRTCSQGHLFRSQYQSNRRCPIQLSISQRFKKVQCAAPDQGQGRVRRHEQPRRFVPKYRSI